MRIFKKKGYVISLDQDIGEPVEHFVDRGVFVVSQKPSNEEEYEKCTKFSRIFRNWKYNKCEYGVQIMKELEVMIELMYDE